MGFTPLEGLMMGTRSGSIDPAILTYIMRREGISFDEMDAVLNRESGVLGVSGLSADMRDVLAAAMRATSRRGWPSTCTCTGCRRPSAASTRP